MEHHHQRKKRKVVEVPPLPEGVGGAQYGEFMKIPERLLSRVLYANPVCMLLSGGEGGFNVMTISWLSCVNNEGVVMLSMNEGRRTAEILFKEGYDGRFTLCVPVQGAELLLRRIGGESGKNVDKFSTLNLTLCPIGTSNTPLTTPTTPAAIDHPLIVAHLDCSIISGTHAHGHHVFTAQITSAHVRSRYWTGDTFQPASPDLPPYLTFFGSGKFGGAVPIEATATVPGKGSVKTDEAAEIEKLREEKKRLEEEVVTLKRENRELKKRTVPEA